jgi:hypothetical protein
MKYAVEMGFIKMGLGIQKIIGGGEDSIVIS